MALLALKDIGKIYVSEGSVAVGIRGVNLSFDKGEFVAITGKSGSGKSTLLNVISGMDSYEEGELFIEGQSTSHYLQADWEEYREKYISFIFQDYNIIESFTVLQNVELALMHIEDKKERRRRAVELLERVGLGDRMRQKGSKLSGGQKQRTVIARALAKDSPIILADEPTGNLDSVTSAEIIELLKEVSRDKLLIVVTHNFEQVEAHATRHVRIYDGAVESDHVLAKPETAEDVAAVEASAEATKKSTPFKKQFKNGLELGRTIFTAKPKLSLFWCALMILGTLGVFLITSFCGEVSVLFQKNYMFQNIEGRMVITTQDGLPFEEGEIENLAKRYGAVSFRKYDALLDEAGTMWSYVDEIQYAVQWRYSTGEDYGDDIIGRYPTAADEVFLYLPITFEPMYGKDELKTTKFFDSTYSQLAKYTVTGVKYFYDNNMRAEALLTEEGFRTCTTTYFLSETDNPTVDITLSVDGEVMQSMSEKAIYMSFDCEDGKVYFGEKFFDFEDLKEEGVELDITFRSTYESYDVYYDDRNTVEFRYDITEDMLTQKRPETTTSPNSSISMSNSIVFSDELLWAIADAGLAESYVQASLFFEDYDAAYDAVDGLREEGYIAVPADTTYKMEAFEMIGMLVACIVIGFLWVATVVFLAFFINLCSSRTMEAFKSDMAIMRSMGIQVKVIRIAMYVRMVLSLIPSYVVVIAVAYWIFTSPTLNEYFVFLYPWQYVVIFFGIMFLTIRITRKQVRKLFGESVKASLKGGAAE